MDGTEICVGHPDTVALALQDGGRCQLQHPQPNPAALSSALGKGIQRIVRGGDFTVPKIQRGRNAPKSSTCCYFWIRWPAGFLTNEALGRGSAVLHGASEIKSPRAAMALGGRTGVIDGSMGLTRSRSGRKGSWWHQL